MPPLGKQGVFFRPASAMRAREIQLAGGRFSGAVDRPGGNVALPGSCRQGATPAGAPHGGRASPDRQDHP